MLRILATNPSRQLTTTCALTLLGANTVISCALPIVSQTKRVRVGLSLRPQSSVRAPHSTAAAAPVDVAAPAGIRRQTAFELAELEQRRLLRGLRGAAKLAETVAQRAPE